MAPTSERVTQLQSEMRSRNVDCTVLRLGENILMATGYWLQLPGAGLAVVPQEGEAALLIPDYEEPEARERWGGHIRSFPFIRLDGPPTGKAIEGILQNLAREHGLAGGAIGFEGSFEQIAPPSFAGEPNAVALPTQDLLRATFSTKNLVDVTSMLEQVKSVKTAHELDRIRVANEVATFGLEAFKEHALPGRTEAEIMAEVEAAVIRRGHGYKGTRVARAWATISSGPETANGWQYFRSRDRVVEKDDVVMLELGSVSDGYWTDHTRTVVAGRATNRQREAFAAVLEAQRAAFAACKPGASGHEVDAASRAACAASGFEQFLHHTGHGVGFRYHESMPQLVPGSEHVLAANMTLITEPGIYEDGLGGFRVEDDAVVTDDGAELFTRCDYDLD